MKNDIRSEAGNIIVPRSFQCPNFYVDALQILLTANEFSILMKAVREILGWKNKIEDRTARISYSRFSETGLGLAAIKTALEGLSVHNILIPGDTTNEGTEYRLNDNADTIDLAGLERRYERTLEKERKRTKKASLALAKKRGIDGRYTSENDKKGIDGRYTSLSTDDSPGVSTDGDNKNQVKTNLKPDSVSREKILACLEPAFNFAVWRNQVGPILTNADFVIVNGTVKIAGIAPDARELFEDRYLKTVSNTLQGMFDHPVSVVLE